MFKFLGRRKKQTKETTVSQERYDEVVGSKSVVKHWEETYQVRVPINSSAMELAAAKLELQTYAELSGYSDATIRRRKEAGYYVFWFRGPSGTTGQNYNRMIFKNIVWVEDVIAQRQAATKR